MRTPEKEGEGREEEGDPLVVSAAFLGCVCVGKLRNFAAPRTPICLWIMSYQQL